MACAACLARGVRRAPAAARAGSSPPSLFIVGDPKQSIYRFRGAEPRVFEAAADFVRRWRSTASVLACDHTRRNAPRGDRGDQRRLRGGRRRGRVRGLSRAHDRGRSGPATASGGCRASPARPPNREGKRRRRRTQIWRDTPADAATRAPTRCCASSEAARAADLLRRWLDAGDARRRDDAAGPQARIAAPRRRRAASARRGAFGRSTRRRWSMRPARRTWSRSSTCWPRRSHGLSLARALRSPLFGASDADLRRALAHGQSRAGGLVASAAVDSPSRRPRWPGRARSLRGWAAAAAELPPHDLLGRIVARGRCCTRATAAALPPEQRAGRRSTRSTPCSRRRCCSTAAATRRPMPSCARCKQRAVKAALPVRAAAVRLLTVHGAKGLEADTVLRASTPTRSSTATELRDAARRLAGRGRARRCAAPSSTTSTRCPPSLRDRARRRVRRARARGAERALRRDDAREAAARRSARPSPTPRPSGTTWWQRRRARACPTSCRCRQARRCSGRCPRRCRRRAAPPAVVASASRRAEPGSASSSTTVVRPRRRRRRARARPRRAPRARVGRAGAAVVEGPRRRSVAAAREFGADPAAVRRHVAAASSPMPTGARFFRGPQIRWSGNEVPVSDAGEVLRIDRLVLARRGRRAGLVGARLQAAAMRPRRSSLSRSSCCATATQSRARSRARRCAAPSSTGDGQGRRDRLGPAARVGRVE